MLRPKFSLDHAQIQGDAITIPAEEFTELTTRTYPYPRVGTRAPDGMFPHTGNPGNPIVRAPYGYVRDGSIVRGVGGLTPHYTLDKATVQGVMPASTYAELTGKLTTAPELPPQYVTTRAPSVVRAPTLQDWGMFVFGAIGGIIFTVAMIYGVIPALAEWGVAAIKKRY